MPSLEDVTQKFIADVSEYVERMREAVAAAREFADANARSDLSADALRGSIDHLAEVVTVLGDRLDHSATTATASADAMNHLQNQTSSAARADVELSAAVADADHELDKERDKALEAASALSRLRDKALEAAASLTAMGTAADVASAAVGPAAGVGGMIGKFALLGGAAGALAPAVTAAAGSMGAFALVAGPALAQIVQGASQAYQAEQALQSAVTSQQKQQAIQQMAQAWKGLDAQQRKAAEAIVNFRNAWANLSTQFEPQILKIVNAGLGMLTKLLHELVPLAHAGGNALLAFIQVLSKGFGSPAFLQFLHQMQVLAVPAAKALGGLLVQALKLVGQVLMAAAPVTLEFIGDLTKLLAAVGPVLADGIRVLATLFTKVLTAVLPLLGPLSQLAVILINAVGSSFMALVPVISKLVLDLLPLLQSIIQAITPILANFLTPNSPAVTAMMMLVNDVLPPLISLLVRLMNFIASNPWIAHLAVDALSAFFAFKALMGVVGLLAPLFSALISPIGLVVVAIAGLIIGFVELYRHSQAVRNIVHDVAEFFKRAWHEAMVLAGEAIHWFVNGPLVSIKQAIAQFAKWWDDHHKQIEQVARMVWKIIKEIITVDFLTTVAIIRATLIVAESVWRAAWNIIASITRTVWNVLKITIGSSIREIKDIITIVLDIITGHWRDAWNHLKDLASTIMHQIVSVIGAIVHGLADLLFNAGAHAVENLAHGMLSAIGSVISAGKSIIGSVAGFFGLSPAKWGPFSGSGAPEIRGLHISQDLARGIMAGLPLVQQALSRIIPGGTMLRPGGFYPGGVMHGVPFSRGAPVTPGFLGGMNDYIQQVSAARSGGYYGGMLAATAGAAAASPVHVTVPVTVSPSAGALTSPQFLTGLQPVIQEAVLRYVQLNQSNGLFGLGRRS